MSQAPQHLLQAWFWLQSEGGGVAEGRTAEGEDGGENGQKHADGSVTPQHKHGVLSDGSQAVLTCSAFVSMDNSAADEWMNEKLVAHSKSLLHARICMFAAQKKEEKMNVEMVTGVSC